MNLGKVQRLVLRSTVVNGVNVKLTGRPGDVGKPLEECETYWERRWVDRDTLRRTVYDMRSSDVSKASNRVSVSRAVRTLVDDKQLLDAQFPATGTISGGELQLTHYGAPLSSSQRKLGSDGDSPTYSLVRLSNKGESVARELRSADSNDWGLDA